MRLRKTLLFIVFSLLFACPVYAGQVQKIDSLTVVFLSGSPYEIGYQHGALLHDEVHASVSLVLRFFRRFLKVPWVRTVLVNNWLDSAWNQAVPYLPDDIKNELRGLADGSGVALRELYRLHAIPERTYSCANFAAWGKATAGGRMVHMRNLDWNIRANIQQYPVVFVIHPNGKRAFVNVAWAGFAGVLTGINDAQVSIGQIGAETEDISFKGEPMTFVMRRVLEEAADVDTAARLIEAAKRTGGANSGIADAKVPTGIAIETNHTHLHVFHADDSAEKGINYARPITDVVFRADAAMDPDIRNRQLASHGDPKRPGLEDPVGSSAYDVRYLGQAAGILAHYGKLDAEAAKKIAKKVAPDSNVQSVVFAWPDLWIANANNQIPAAKTGYHRFNLPELFSQPVQVQ